MDDREQKLNRLEGMLKQAHQNRPAAEMPPGWENLAMARIRSQEAQTALRMGRLEGLFQTRAPLRFAGAAGLAAAGVAAVFLATGGLDLEILSAVAQGPEALLLLALL